MNYKEIKSYEDACKVLGLKPLADEVFNAFPKAEREDVKAYHQLSVITKAINEGWALHVHEYCRACGCGYV